MNEVSIIINGVRYDAVDVLVSSCKKCDLREECHKRSNLLNICCIEGHNFVFKKSTKSFEP